MRIDLFCSRNCSLFSHKFSFVPVGFNRVGRDVYPAQPDTAARSLFDSYDSSARKPPPHSRDTSTSYPFPATAAESTMPRPVLDAPRGDARQASRDRSSARSRSRSRISLPPSATSGPAVAYSRGDSFSSAAPYAGRDSKDSRDRQAPRSRSRDNVHRGHSRDGRDGNRDVSRIVNNRDSYDYPAGSYYDYNNNSYPSPAGSDRYPDNRYGYDAYGYDGYDDRGYGAYPAYDRYDAYGPQQGRADYEYGETRNAYGNSAQQSSSSVGGRYRDDRQASSWRNGARAEGQGLVRQGSAGSLTSRRSRSRSPPPPSHAQAGGAGGVETAGNPVRGAHSVERGGRRVVERSASRQGAQQPGLVRNNSNFRGTANNAQNTSACTSNISPPAASATGAAAAAPIATAVATAAATTAPISPRAATPLQEEREPGESTPISSPEAPAAGKRFNREVILAKQNHQPTFNNGYGGKGDFSGNLGGGSGSGFKGKQGQFSSQYQGGGAYGQNQGQQQQQVHYGSHQGGQQGQQGGHMLNKQQQNKFQKGGYSGPPQQAQVQPSGALSQMAGGSGGLRPSPGKKAQTGGAPVVITTEVAPLKTPR